MCVGHDVYDSKGWTPLHHAAEVGSWLLVNLLMENGADLGTKAHDTVPDTPVHIAAINGQTE